MSARTDQRENIVTALKGFSGLPLPDAARALFATLGYASERRIAVATPQQFCEELDPQGRLTSRERETLDRLTSLHFLFQLTDAELTSHGDLFDNPSAVQTTQIHSYVFFAAELPEGHYTRTDLSAIARALNKPLSMPALLLLKHGDTVSLAIIHRRLNKRDTERDVLEKATLIKDIRLDDPIRAHLEILNDFALANLDADFGTPSFVKLHEAWQKRLSSYALSNDFYREIADWYFWAHHLAEDGTLRLPEHCDTEQEKSLFLIRLLTRVIFCWFLVEKRLIPADLFRDRPLKKLLKDFKGGADIPVCDLSSSYYHAILQNLFFGTLNMPDDLRSFRDKKKDNKRYDPNYGITNLWRYQTDFKDSADWVALSKRIPFLNGGLFDCLDDKSGKKQDNSILDGFSDNPKLACQLPNDLFFGPERNVDLSKDYGEEDKRTARSKKAKVRGLIEILSRYKFTIEENTPLEEEIALDPELLGKVFENLLASYNEDTRTTARKALGAFYTPREIVSYMVDEALKSYLSTQVPRCKGALDDLFSNKATLKEVKPDTRDALIAAIGRVKILDPACGSGAFPMGALHRLVDLLQKLDPNNESWKRDRLAEAERYRKVLEESGAPKEEIAACDARIEDITKSFDTRFHALDFARKLYLIENGIYGVDIQPVAVQIAKLRFFISLVVDQKVCMSAKNLGVRPLPNLETRLVAADSLIPLPKPTQKQASLFDDDVGAYLQLQKLKDELKRIRHEHFNARDPNRKRHWRDEDQRVRETMRDLLRKTGLPSDTAKAMSAWDPYDQNTFAPFFDAEWMFGLKPEYKQASTILDNLALVNETDGQMELSTDTKKVNESGFDIVIGNPPYVRMEQIKHLKPIFSEIYNCFSGRADLYVYFYERSLSLLKQGGVLAFITSDTFFTREFGQKLRLFLTEKTSIEVLIDFGETGVFTAFTEPCIILARRGGEPNTKVRVLKWDEKESVNDVRAKIESKLFALPQSHFQGTPWRIESPKINEVLALMERYGETVGSITNHRILYGIKTGLNDAFIINETTRNELLRKDKASKELIKPFIRGRDIGRWTIAPTTEWLIYIPKGTDLSRFSAIEHHLKPFQKALESRATKQEWYELQQSQLAYYDDFCGSKIVFQDIARSYGMAWDDDGHFLANTCYFIPGPYKWLLGLLMSAPMRFYVHKVLGADEGGFIRLFSGQVDRFPIPICNDSHKIGLEMLTNRLLNITHIITTHPTDQSARDPLMLAYFEQILNGLVYELYFPEEVHEAGLHLFDVVEQANLPSLDTLPEANRLPHLRTLFESLYDGTHPLRIALSKLQTLDTVRIIEGADTKPASTSSLKIEGSDLYSTSPLSTSIHKEQTHKEKGDGSFYAYVQGLQKTEEGVTITLDAVPAGYVQNLPADSDRLFDQLTQINTYLVETHLKLEQWKKLQLPLNEETWVRMQISNDAPYPGTMAEAYSEGDLEPVRLMLSALNKEELEGILAKIRLPSESPLNSIKQALTSLRPATDTFVAVYNVGQGLCCAICNAKDCSPLIYFDMGCGCYWNAHTLPKKMRFCFTHKPPIILSHWHVDHFMAARFHDTRALDTTWIAPLQKVGPTSARFAAELAIKGKLLLWPTSQLSIPTPFGDIVKCTGTTLNTSGLALLANVSNGASTSRSDIHVLLPGDAGYDDIPNISSTPFDALVASHHGGEALGTPPLPRGVEPPYVLSFGINNTYHHPNETFVDDLEKAGWSRRIETVDGHVALGIPSTVRLRQGCKGKKCDLTIQQR